MDTSLSDNGGSTLTHRLMINSPAIDAGDPAMMSGGTMQFDQRGSGFDRIVGGRIDIGAVEVQSVTSLSCDFNQDGSCDATDINMLQANIVAGPVNPERFDLTNDGLVNVDDRNEWLALAGAENLASGNAYLLGDANLDGRVDVSDFNLWNSNKFNTTSDWTAADLNADGLVDVSDFNLWNSNKFRLSDSAARDSGHDDLNRREREDEYVRRNLIDLLFGDGARG